MTGVIPAMRSHTWVDRGQSVRELVQSILVDRLDIVDATCLSVESLARIQGLGFPSTFTGASDPVATDRGPGPLLYGCRLEPFLDVSVRPVLERHFEVSAGDISTFGEQSGDLNPLHFDDGFARAHGFKGRIAHGMIFSGWLTKLLGTEYPGPGTIFMRSATLFLAPVYPDLPHTVRVSAPTSDPAKGTARIVAQLMGADGRHCLVAYSDVLKRDQ